MIRMSNGRILSERARLLVTAACILSVLAGFRSAGARVTQDPQCSSARPTSIADRRLPAFPRQLFDRLDSAILQRPRRIGHRVARQVAVDQRHRSTTVSAKS
jgi:hypothetical protein